MPCPINKLQSPKSKSRATKRKPHQLPICLKLQLNYLNNIRGYKSYIYQPDLTSLIFLSLFDSQTGAYIRHQENPWILDKHFLSTVTCPHKHAIICLYRSNVTWCWQYQSDAALAGHHGVFVWTLQRRLSGVELYDYIYQEILGYMQYA